MIFVYNDMPLINLIVGCNILMVAYIQKFWILLCKLYLFSRVNYINFLINVMNDSKIVASQEPGTN